MILIDAGPLVALHDREDSRHSSCTHLLQSLGEESLATTWACFAEAVYLLGQGGGFHFQSRLWHSRATGLFAIVDLLHAEIDHAAELMKKYQDLPMDLADATLVALADCRGWRRAFTLDSHFYAYRLRDGSALEVILPTI